ncbi:hypothetical protein CEG15_03460 [Vibrio anguillarum]|nr:hypothetical protein CEG15_03460 [Vibrio anguillarum]
MLGGLFLLYSSQSYEYKKASQREALIERIWDRKRQDQREKISDSGKKKAISRAADSGLSLP